MARHRTLDENEILSENASRRREQSRDCRPHLPQKLRQRLRHCRRVF